MQTIFNDDQATCRIDQALPARSQRLGYTGLLQSPEDAVEIHFLGVDRRGNRWRYIHRTPEHIARTVYRCGNYQRGVIEHVPPVNPLPDDGSDDMAVMIIADLNRASRRYGRHAEDVAQEAFRLVWEGITSDDPPGWIDFDDYKGTLRKAVRRARQLVVFRHVPPPLHQLLRLSAPPDSTLYDGPAECFSALSRMVPDMPARAAELIAVAASLGFDRNDTPADQWEVLAEMISEAEEKTTVVAKSTVERRLGLARVFVVLGSIIADSVE